MLSTRAGWSDKDKEKIVELLNFIAVKAKFEMDVKECIKFYGLLNWAQQELIRKIDMSILEVKAIREPEPAPEPEPQPKSRGRGKSSAK